MNQHELNGAKEAFEYAIKKAKESKQHDKNSRKAKISGNEITAEIEQRQTDLARGEALGVAQALTFIGGDLRCKRYPKAIYDELDE